MSKGGFWTAGTPGTLAYEPKMKHRFRVFIEGFAMEDSGAKGQGDAYEDTMADDALVWYAKSIDKPKISMGLTAENDTLLQSPTTPLMLVNNAPTVNAPLKMVLVDPSYPNATRKLLRLFRRAGFQDDKALGINDAKTFQGDKLVNSTGAVIIQQLDANGIALETWELIGAFPLNVDFGSLSYSEDSLVEITIEWGYNTFFATTHGRGANISEGTGHDGEALQPDQGYDDQMAERTFSYFKDFDSKLQGFPDKTDKTDAPPGNRPP
jgi:hypothetical protein